MHFIATLEHAPDNCWARPENEEMANEYIADTADRAADHGVEVHGAYAAPNEHAMFFVLEADSFDAVSRFLGPPLLQDHEGDVTPVMTFDTVLETILGD